MELDQASVVLAWLHSKILMQSKDCPPRNLCSLFPYAPPQPLKHPSQLGGICLRVHIV